MEDIKSKMHSRGVKAFMTLISQFQLHDKYYTCEVKWKQFYLALGYFKSFHLSDTQL